MENIRVFKLDKSLKITEEYIEKEKACFQERKNFLYGNLLYTLDDIEIKNTESIEDSKINKYLKDEFKKEKKINKDYFFYAINAFLLSQFGIKYCLLNNNQKDEFMNSDFTYDSIKKLAYEVTENNIKDCKKELPEKVYECFDDYCFIMFFQLEDNSKINKSNFLLRIRDYFILDKEKEIYELIRNATKFEEIRNNMINIYGELKEEYGKSNPTWEKFLSYFSEDTDYNYYETTEILNNYYKNKKYKDYKLVKQKED